jgi:hypothetical protein
MEKEMPSNKRNKIRTTHTRKENFHVNRLNMLMDRETARASAVCGRDAFIINTGGGRKKKRIKQTLYDDVLLGGYSIEK